MNERASIDVLWKATLGPDGFEGLDPRATCLPPGSDEVQGVDTAGWDFRAAATMVPELLDEPDTDRFTDEHPDLRESGLGSVAQAGLVLGEVIGEGGVARVHLAEQASLHRDVAVKVVREPKAARSFVAEARVTGALDHPNVLPVHDLVPLDASGAPALVMKYVRGQSWQDHLDDMIIEERKDVAREVGTLMSVCQGVAYAHAHGVLHLDLKPANVMLGDFGEVFVTDWGCAVIAREEGNWVDQTSLPRVGEIRNPFGTPSYMPPELARGDASAIDERSDVYLLGAMLYEVLTGTPPRRGAMPRQIVEDAVAGVVEPLPEDAPAGLADLVAAALAPDPADRPESVTAFRERLGMWLETRESRRITREAGRRLARIEARLAGLAVIPREDEEGADEALLELVGALQQARQSWPENEAATQAEHRVRTLLAERAIDRREAGLAESHARHLPEEDAVRTRILAEAEAVRSGHRRQVTRVRLLRWGLGGALAAMVLTGLVALVLVERARQDAREAADMAAERLDEVMRLADHTRLGEVRAEADRLWPAVPDRVPAMRAWLDDARVLIDDRPTHQAALAALGGPTPDEPVERRWRRGLLADLLIGLDDLERDLVPEVEARLAVAESLEHRSITEHAEAWSRVAEAVRSDPRFGFDLAPQLGLVPLGPDPRSGLQEFAHLLTGEVPERTPRGALSLGPEHGVVLVLVPGGAGTVGAAPDDPIHPDPRSREAEGPVHTVQLEPWFMAKHELTQAQWRRLTESRPSAYPIGYELGEHTITGMHPVEQMRWDQAMDAVRRGGLTLPTEAQWEIAARAGSATPWWTGAAPRSLQGAANLADRWARDHGGPESWRYEPFLTDGWLAHAPIGGRRPNAWGLHDTAGNVWEWCLDRYGAYTLPVVPGTGLRQVPGDAPHVFRGGGFRSTVSHARSADRYSLYAEDYRAYDVGIRAARAVE